MFNFIKSSLIRDDGSGYMIGDDGKKIEFQPCKRKNFFEGETTINTDKNKKDDHIVDIEKIASCEDNENNEDDEVENDECECSDSETINRVLDSYEKNIQFLREVLDEEKKRNNLLQKKIDDQFQQIIDLSTKNAKLKQIECMAGNPFFWLVYAFLPYGYLEDEDDDNDEDQDE